MNKLNRLIRADGFHSHIHKVSVCGIYLIGTAAAAMFVALVLHYLFPDHVLSPDQASDLQSFLFSGGLGALLTKGVKQASDNDPGKEG